MLHIEILGRGGAGFPTGMKWDFCSKAKGDKKYVICNADEGDSGAYSDRYLLEDQPLKVEVTDKVKEGIVFLHIFHN